MAAKRGKDHHNFKGGAWVRGRDRDEPEAVKERRRYHREYGRRRRGTKAKAYRFKEQPRFTASALTAAWQR